MKNIFSTFSSEANTHRNREQIMLFIYVTVDDMLKNNKGNAIRSFSQLLIIASEQKYSLDHLVNLTLYANFLFHISVDKYLALAFL